MAKSKAYLVVQIDTKVLPPVIVAAEIAMDPLTCRTVIAHEGIRWVEWFHVSGRSWEEAQAKMLRQIKGEEPCPIGDLRFLWPFVDPSEDAYMARYHLRKRIQETIKTMPANDLRPSGQPAWVMPHPH